MIKYIVAGTISIVICWFVSLIMICYLTITSIDVNLISIDDIILIDKGTIGDSIKDKKIFLENPSYIHNVAIKFVSGKEIKTSS